MTEDEAKQRWCPFARVGSSRNGLGSMNREALSSEADADLVERNTRCIASACMAWRTRPVRSHQQDVTREGKPLGAPRDAVALDGFCGLAGAPQ